MPSELTTPTLAPFPCCCCSKMLALFQWPCRSPELASLPPPCVVVGRRGSLSKGWWPLTDEDERPTPRRASGDAGNVDDDAFIMPALPSLTPLSTPTAPPPPAAMLSAANRCCCSRLDETAAMRGKEQRKPSRSLRSLLFCCSRSSFTFFFFLPPLSKAFLFFVSVFLFL